MNVLSLFDGISCGQVALKKLGISINNYYASEIDKYAIKITQKNHPDTIQLGTIENWFDWDIDFESIDLILAGSPCQGFSYAGKCQQVESHGRTEAVLLLCCKGSAHPRAHPAR